MVLMGDRDGHLCDPGLARYHVIGYADQASRFKGADGPLGVVALHHFARELVEVAGVGYEESQVLFLLREPLMEFEDGVDVVWPEPTHAHFRTVQQTNV